MSLSRVGVAALIKHLETLTLQSRILTLDSRSASTGTVSGSEKYRQVRTNTGDVTQMTVGLETDQARVTHCQNIL